MSHLTQAIQQSFKDHQTLPLVTLKKTFAYHRYSYKQIETLTRRTITWLKAQKIKRGDRIAICSYNCPQYFYTYLACLFQGVIIVPIDYGASQTFITKLLKQTNTKLIIASQFKKINDVIPAKAVIPSKTKKPTLHHVETLDHTVAPYKMSPLTHTTKDSDIVQILYTSGTTGVPKGVMLTHLNIHSNITAAGPRISIDPTFKLLSILPLSHILEQVGGFLAIIIFGGQVIHMQSRRGSEILKLLNHEHINSLITVPALLQLFKTRIEDQAKESGKHEALQKLLSLSPKLPLNLRRKLFKSIHAKFGGELIRILCGGAPLSKELEAFWNALGVEIIKGYGLTETSPVLTLTPHRQRKLGSVGTAIPGVELIISDQNEVQTKGTNVFQGYYQNTKATRATFTKDGWFKTGDLGHIDPSGHIFLKGRLKNMIVKPNGKNIYPEDIEVHLNQTPLIKEAVVIGIPAKNDILITAIILPEEGSKLTKAKLKPIIKMINQKLETHQQIQNYQIWPEPDFPRTLTLKIKRFEVQKIISKESLKPKNSKLKPKHFPLISILAELSHTPAFEITPSTRLTHDLGFDSLKVIELAVKIEEVLKITVPEHLITPKTTVNRLQQIIKDHHTNQRQPLQVPSSMFRHYFDSLKKIIPEFTLPIIKHYANPLTINNFKVLKKLPPQLIIISNHLSHMDAPLILSQLPTDLRTRLGIAARYDYFFEEKSPAQKVIAWSFMHLGGGFPLVRDFSDTQHSVTDSFDIAADIVDRGWSLLIFPEGTRNTSDTLLPFKTGTGLLIKEFNLPVLPLRLKGFNHILPKGTTKPMSRPATLTFGQIQTFPPNQTPTQITHLLQETIQQM